MALTFRRLRQILDYNPKTGVFTWRVQRGCRPQGSRAGFIDKRPNKKYRIVRIDNVLYPASSLAILWMRKRWPKNIVDHRNGTRDDDRWTNLREATHSQNGGNSIARGGKYSSLKGVCWSKAAAKYQAQIKVNYRHIYLGLFPTAAAAHAAYVIAAKKYFGEYARSR